MRFQPERYISQLDSSKTLLQALCTYFQGNAFPNAGITPVPNFLAGVVQFLPQWVRSQIYTYGGWWEGIDKKKLSQVQSQDITRWALDHYPGSCYGGLMLGSSNGAAIHLAAALKTPWLPQTVMIPVRRRCHPDDVWGDKEWGEKVRKVITENNRDLAVYQAHDPIQDRLLMKRVSLFRLKQLQLHPPVYHFLNTKVLSDSPVITIECNHKWPLYTSSERSFFQVGGFGDVRPREYIKGSRRVGHFLRENNSGLSLWTNRGPDTTGPEAEWGFQKSILESIRKIKNRTLIRVIFRDPEDLSPFVADLYSFWYGKYGYPETSQIIAESFCLLEPFLAERYRLLPFWMAFNTSVSLRSLSGYVKKRTINRILTLLFAPGVKGIGAVSVDQWYEQLISLGAEVYFPGTKKQLYPCDPGFVLRYHDQLKKLLSARPHPPLPKLQPDEMLSFYKKNRWKYSVKIVVEKL
ncbi:hypothetical protein QA601_08600 [Chitinispirillales bacterium ANBcel5]|uniref:hypothetical protein n=1 Tax=Cellulosispirillum alkaliphilum TaxID=3039283 RepID=UPI002A51DD9B|nr:hypothetical protein [Chitinispirillales bacterium ANBcel5]